MFDLDLFASDLLVFRTKANVSRKKASDLIGVHGQTIYDIESGRATNPSIDTVLLITDWIQQPINKYII
jgi:DNA-binding XRE family transcriptional regulator